MVVGISDAIGALKSAYDVAKALKNINDRVALNAAIIDLQEKILDAQDAAFAARENETALVKRIDDLEQAVARTKAWDGQKEQYSLVNVGSSCFAYLKKPEMRGGETAHYLCTTCFDAGKKAILHHMEVRTMGDQLACPTCNVKMMVSHDYKPPA